jgi:hypothetical protein
MASSGSKTDLQGVVTLCAATCLALTAFASIFFAVSPAYPATVEPIVFVLSYHNLEYAKDACDHAIQIEPDARRRLRNAEQYALQLTNEVFVAATGVLAGASECRSVGDQRELGRRLENKLIDALRANSQCSGVTILQDSSSDYEKAGRLDRTKEMGQSSSYWELQIHFNPGSNIYGWNLVLNEPLPKSTKASINGEGDTVKNADQICFVVTKRIAR